MRVLIACEYSGRVRDAFSSAGHDATSCDLIPSDSPGSHVQRDVSELLHEQWDAVIAFPPCTYLSTVGARYWPMWQAQGHQQRAEEFFMQFTRLDHIPRVAIENPVGRMSSSYRRPDQIVQPWWFGDPWIKRTCLWLKGFPKLVADREVQPVGHWVDGGTYRSEGAYAVKGGGGKLEGAYEGAAQRGIGNKSRAHERAKTFPGLARAMAQQWGAAPLRAADRRQARTPKRGHA